MSNDQLAKGQAESDLNDIIVLKKALPFQRYYQRRLGEITSEFRAKWEDPTLSAEQLKGAQEAYFIAKRFRDLLENDEAANRSIIG